MKKIFVYICFSLFFVGQVMAAAREFSSVEDAQQNVSERNQEIIEQQKHSHEDMLPTDPQERTKYLIERLDNADIQKFPATERLDKPSSFSMVDDESLKSEKKSFWQKIYDDAVARVSGQKKGVGEDFHPVEYYSLNEPEDKNESLTIPQIDLTLPNGLPLNAPAFEHIPTFSTQIEILPNGMLKIIDNVTIIANGRKVREGISRFIPKKSALQDHKLKIILDQVLVNDTEVAYEVKEQNEYYVLRPVSAFELPEGVYVFSFRYFVDRALVEQGDFYEFYWNVTGGQFNLLTTTAIASVKLPGREPAVKKYALTGNGNDLTDKNAVFMDGEENTIGFMSLYPLPAGDSLHIFLTLPKVDFLPINFTQQLVWMLEDYGDIILCAIYLLVVAISCSLSWLYIRKRLKFRNVVLPNAILVRALWRGGADKKSIGCMLLELFKRNVIEIESKDEDILLVRKTAHARHLAKFERKILSLLFTKKDSVCRLQKGAKLQALWKLVSQETKCQVRRLGWRLSGIYVLFNILMLVALQIALAQWNNTSFLAGILVLVDILLLIMVGVFAWLRGALWKQILAGFIVPVALATAGLIMSVYLHWLAIIMMLVGVCIALIFSHKASGQDALLKNAVQSAYQMHTFLSQQKENIASGRNFAAQQANIFALDLENEYPNNDKIKSHYRLSEVEKLLDKF